MNDLNQPLEVVHGDCGCTSSKGAYEQYRDWFESQPFYTMFGEMRHPTEEENKAFAKVIDELFVPLDVGMNVFDL